MKRTKRFASIATAALLAACAVVPSMASIPASAAANTITLTQVTGDKASHTYTAYKIFDGVVKTTTSGDAEAKELTGIQWATGISTDASTGFLANLKASTLAIDTNDPATTLGSLFTDCDTAASVAKVLMENNTNEKMVRQFAEFVKSQNLTAVGTATSTEGADATITLTTADPETKNDGYYLIVDTISSTDSTPVQDSAVSRYMLQTVDASEGLDIEVKSSLPTVVKKVKENTNVDDYKFNGGETAREADADYNDVADYNIGDSVPFRLYGTLPDTLTDYDTYKYVFHDTLGKEFTLGEGFTVKVEVVGNDGNTKTTLENTAFKLETTAASGDNGNTITVTIDDVTAIENIASTDQIIVSYTATLNTNAEIGTPGQTNEVYLEYSNNPNSGGEGSTGKTPTDKVIVFTYELDVTKVDAGTNTALKDAEFLLYRGSGADTEYAVLDDDMKVTDWLKGTLEVATDGTISFTKSASANNTEATTPTVLKSAEDGTFKVIGLDDGAYSLKETKAPSGYNLLTTDVALTIDATTSNGQTEDASGDELTAIKVSVTGESASANGDNGAGNVENGTVSLDVKNNSGSVLPSTGGIGTTIFYTVGGVLVVGAGVLLITKKRAKNAE